MELVARAEKLPSMFKHGKAFSRFSAWEAGKRKKANYKRLILLRTCLVKKKNARQSNKQTNSMFVQLQS